jgi:antitoxin CptB
MGMDSRIYWRCRRGMRELEELLLDFGRVHYDGLSAGERHAFERLLDYSDQVLLEYTMGDAVPRDRKLAELISKIRRGANP